MPQGSISYEEMINEGLMIIRKAELELLFEDINRLGYANAQMHNALEMLSTTYALWEKNEPYTIEDYIKCINKMNQDAADVLKELRHRKSRNDANR